MLRIGIAGIGFMGMIHYLACQKLGQVKVTAVCSRNKKRLAGDWTDIKGNFGPPGQMMDLAGIARHATLEAMLADPNVDLVDLCLPPSVHASSTRAAFAAGKHVFCEKPMALSPAECDAMVAAARSAGKTLHIGHVLPFFPEYAFALEAARSGRYGRVLGGHFQRTISDPQWLPDFFDPAKVGGPMLDLHVHDAHFIRLLFGMPVAVTSQGRLRGEVVEYFNSQFRFADPALCVSASGGVIRQQGRAFTHSYEIHFERATLLYDFAVIDGNPVLAMPCTVLEENGQVTRPQLGSGDPVEAFVAEIADVAGAATSGVESSILAGGLARDAVVLCQKQTESAVKGRPVKVKGALESFLEGV